MGRKFSRVFAPAFALLATSVLAQSRAADVSLEIVRDNVTQVSYVSLSGAGGEVLATTSWDAPVPVGYDVDRTVYYLPAVLLAQLRDQLGTPSRGDAAEARRWVLLHLGPLASVPASGIEPNVLSGIGIDPVAGAKWCGDNLIDKGGKKECVDLCSSTCGVIKCCGCKCGGNSLSLDLK